ncbi:YbaB/EbfC family nucleoid-associated protein [candidate division KSB1 bacterium]|nr:YbaB/EbfC family nucleoid-associated protein [candidate division KSB1 bacterium]
MGAILKQAQKMQKDLQKAQENLANIKVQGSAGGGMVTVTASAAQEILEIKIDPEVVDPEDVEMLEDLVLAAINQALENARSKSDEEMGKVTGGMLPGLGGMGLPGF